MALASRPYMTAASTAVSLSKAVSVFVSVQEGATVCNDKYKVMIFATLYLVILAAEIRNFT